MLYRADETHGLPFDPFKAIIAPRPIGWIGTLNADGVPIDSNDLRNLRRVMQLHIASDIAVASGATTPSRRTA